MVSLTSFTSEVVLKCLAYFTRTFLDEPALMVRVEEDFCQFVSSFMVLEGFSLDGIIEALE